MGTSKICAVLLIFVLMTGSLAAGLAKEEIMLPELHFEKKPLPDLESYRFVEGLKAGWNLGNTFDANNAAHLKDEMDYETTWAGVKTEPGVFAALKEAGFGAVRIPVSWHNHVSGMDFTISPAWLARVKEVVDDALNSGLYVILNTHHDIDKDFLYPDNAHLENSRKYLVSVWEQIVPVFKEYDKRLIMESMNEPRLSGTSIEWWLNPNHPSSSEAVRCINELNQAFVDTVRQSGGQNAARYLLVPGYAASVQGCLHDEFAMPKDAEGVFNRLLLSVHAYTPYDFALQSPKEKQSRDTFSAGNTFDVNEIAGFMDQVYRKFSTLEVPVVIGEFGCRDKNGNLQARVDFTAVYVALARARGFTCFWWDNHAFKGDGEIFGLLDRRTFQFIYSEIVRAMLSNAE